MPRLLTGRLGTCNAYQMAGWQVQVQDEENKVRKKSKRTSAWKFNK